MWVDLENIRLSEEKSEKDILYIITYMCNVKKNKCIAKQKQTIENKLVELPMGRRKGGGE